MNCNGQISCHLHDYVEVMCMFKYEVKVFSDAGEFVGKSFDVKVKDKREYLALENSSLEEELIALDTILKIEILTPNARFEKVEFR